MDTNNALMFVRLIRYAAFVDRDTGSDYRSALVEHLKVIATCHALKNKFDEHLPFAGYATILDPQFEPSPPVGPIPFSDTPGYYRWYPPAQGSMYRRVLNADYVAAEAILELAEQLNCDWVNEGREQLEAKTERRSVIELPRI